MEDCSMPQMQRRKALKLALTVTAASLAFGLTVSAQAADDCKQEMWTISLKPKFTDYVNGVIKGYEAANPGCKVEWVDLPADGYQDKLLAAVAAGTPPDVVNLNVPWAHEFYQQGAILAIDQWVGADRSLYFANGLKDVTSGGKLIALPWYNAATVIAMNSDIFKKAGLDPNKAPRTLKEYVGYAKKIKEKTGLYGFMPRLNMIEYFMQEGLPIVQGGKAVFNSPKHVAHVQMWADAYKQDLMPKDTWRRAHEGATEMFTAGKLGMLGTGPQFLSRVKTDNPAVYKVTTVGIHPMGAAKILPSWLMDMAIPKGVKNPAQAVKLAKWVTNDDNQLEFAKQVVIFPSVRKAARDPFFSKLPANPSAEDYARTMGALAVEFSKTLVITDIKNLGDLSKNFDENMEAAIHGQKPVKQALDDAAKFWNANLN
jgi:putative chitobiose transport system substrate-binding protein